MAQVCGQTLVICNAGSTIHCLQVRSLNGQLSEVQDERSRVEERLASIQRGMTEVEEDKRGLGKYHLALNCYQVHIS